MDKDLKDKGQDLKGSKGKSESKFLEILKAVAQLFARFLITHKQYFIPCIILLCIISFMISSKDSLRFLPEMNNGTKAVKEAKDNKKEDKTEGKKVKEEDTANASNESDENNKTEDDSSDVPKIELPETVTNPLILNKDKGLNDFIKGYYAAIEKADIDEVRKHVDVLSDIEINSIRLKAKAREAHKNIKVYTKNGPEEGSLLAYVSLEVKFRDISTSAPGIEPLYIKKDDDGYVIINSMNSSAEELQYTNEAEETEDVVELFAKVDDAYREACSKDKDLVRLLKENGYTVPEIKTDKKEEDKTDNKDTATASNKKPEEAKKPEKTTEKPKEAKKTEKAEKTGKSKGKKYVLTDGIRVRAKKSTTSDVKATAIKDDIVEIIKEYKKGGWVKVKLTANGQTIKGFMKKDILLENSKPKK